MIMSDINITMDMDDWDTLLAAFYENGNPEFEEDDSLPISEHPCYPDTTALISQTYRN